MLNRRGFGVACIAAAALPANAFASGPSQIASLEASLGGRIGVAVLDTQSGRRIAHRADERFAMCSTFKWLLAAMVLAGSDRGQIPLQRRLSYTAPDLPSHSPVTSRHLAEGGMAVEDLCAAAVEESDNGAANLLLRTFGGPQAVTAFARSLGDSVTRLDRYELALNENLPGDPRDSTSPNACIADLQKVLLGEVLKPTSRERLVGWMKNNHAVTDRLRAGLPPRWVVADKTGTGTDRGPTSEMNDIAVVWPQAKAPIVIASYISGSFARPARQSAAHAQIARIVAAAFG
jgi:beta-lactamase class A